VPSPCPGAGREMGEVVSLNHHCFKGQVLSNTVTGNKKQMRVLPPLINYYETIFHINHHVNKIKKKQLKIGNLFFSFFNCPIIVVLRVHCDIYKSSYNIIVELAPCIILLYPPSPHFWNCFNMSHFSIFKHEYITFPPY
jgi:hypothetical protein